MAREPEGMRELYACLKQDHNIDTELVSKKTAASIIGVSVKQLWRFMKAGRIRETCDKKIAVWEIARFLTSNK